MGLTTGNGIREKVCPGCGLRKRLNEFPFDFTEGESQGFRHCHCKACHAEATRQEQLKFNLMRARAIELGIWDSVNARAKEEAKRHLEMRA
jgi:hypothetical protein